MWWVEILVPKGVEMPGAWHVAGVSPLITPQGQGTDPIVRRRGLHPQDWPAVRPEEGPRIIRTADLLLDPGHLTLDPGPLVPAGLPTRFHGEQGFAFEGGVHVRSSVR